MNSLTIRFRQRGFDCELMLADDDTGELMRRADNALTWLEKNGAAPALQSSDKALDGALVGVRPSNGHDPAYCPIHQMPMKAHTKNGQTWYSHRLDDGGWCRGGAAR